MWPAAVCFLFLFSSTVVLVSSILPIGHDEGQCRQASFSHQIQVQMNSNKLKSNKKNKSF
jgi:hypothetical protein